MNMKKKLLSFVAAVLSCLLFMTTTSYARYYSIEDTDISININNDRWYVFTRDNIKNNSEMADLGISYDYMYNNMYNNKIYVDALLLYNDGEYVELFVRKTSIENIVNLSYYDDDKVFSLAEALANKRDVEKYSIYKSQYKFMKLEYSDLGYYICEYVTVVNGENYTLTFQSTKPYTDSEYSEIKEIVDSVRFVIDQSMKEKNDSSWVEGALDEFIGGAVVAVIVSGFSLLVAKNKKEKGNNDIGQ